MRFPAGRPADRDPGNRRAAARCRPSVACPRQPFGRLAGRRRRLRRDGPGRATARSAPSSTRSPHGWRKTQAGRPSPQPTPTTSLAPRRAAARPRGLSPASRMRADMIAGLLEWRDAAPSRGRLVERIEHPGWSIEQLTAPLGVVGFVFEGRPNVFADAAGVLRGGNSVVFRIGSDALGTAKAIVEHALMPALAEAGLPEGACVLVESAEHAAGWALFSDPRLALAVARGSGPAVAQLGAVARQAGLPVSLHGTGGAWLVADEAADAARFARNRDGLAGPQGLQHAERLLHRAVPRGRAGSGVPRSAGRRSRELETARGGRRRGGGGVRPVVVGDDRGHPAPRDPCGSLRSSHCRSPSLAASGNGKPRRRSLSKSSTISTRPSPSSTASAHAFPPR